MPLAPGSVLFGFVAGGQISSAGFSRASDATRRKHDGTVQLTTQAVPRLDWIDPNSTFVLDVPSLLLEETQTNDFTFSEDFSNAAWTKNQVTVSTDAIIAPDGSTTADRIVESTFNAQHDIRRNSTLPSDNTKQTWSIFAKAAERSFIYLQVNNFTGFATRTHFNISTGGIGISSTAHTATIERSANGFFRCAVAVNTSSGLTTPLFFSALATSDGAISYEGSSTAGVYMWGAQLEAD